MRFQSICRMWARDFPCQEIKDYVQAIINQITSSKEFVDKVTQLVSELRFSARRNDFQERAGNSHNRDQQYNGKGKGKGKGRISGRSYTRSRHPREDPERGDKRRWPSKPPNVVTLRPSSSRTPRTNQRRTIKPPSLKRTHDYWSDERVRNDLISWALTLMLFSLFMSAWWEPSLHRDHQRKLFLYSGLSWIIIGGGYIAQSTERK